jgi:hypothetical protein
MNDAPATRTDLYARTATGKAAELYALAGAALDLEGEIRVLRVITAILFADPEKHHASLVRVLPALIRALDIQLKLSGGGSSWTERLAGLAEGMLHDMEPASDEDEDDQEEDDDDEVPW